jgi:hypothetical protein
MVREPLGPTDSDPVVAQVIRPRCRAGRVTFSRGRVCTPVRCSRDAMNQDRTDWEAREYADALNSATGPDLFELVREVNEKYEPRTVRSRPRRSSSRTRRATTSVSPAR